MLVEGLDGGLGPAGARDGRSLGDVLEEEVVGGLVLLLCGVLLDMCGVRRHLHVELSALDLDDLVDVSIIILIVLIVADSRVVERRSLDLHGLEGSLMQTQRSLCR